MKILFDSQAFSNQRFGGVSRYFYEIISKIKSVENVRIFSPFFINEYAKNLDKEIIIGRHVYFQNKLLDKFIRLFNSTLDSKYANIYKPDIIHETFYYGNYNNSKTPHLATCHDMIHELFPEYYKDDKYTTLAKRSCFNRVDKIIAISNKTKSDLINILNIPKEKIEVIYHGIDIKKANEEIRIYDSKDKPFILYVGKRKGYKNFKSLVISMKILLDRNINIDLKCFGGGKFNDDEKKLFDKYKITNNIHHYYGDDSLLNKLYNSSLSYVCTSLYEGFGLPVLEAMNQDCPVISSSCGALAEVIGDKGFFIDPKNPEDISNAIFNLLDDNDLRIKLINYGRKRIKNFTWDSTAVSTINLYKEMIN